MSNEWHETQSWYAPLENARPEEPATLAPETGDDFGPVVPVTVKKRKTWPRVLGALSILLVLIVASSLIFGGLSGRSDSAVVTVPQLPGFGSGAEDGGDSQPTTPPDSQEDGSFPEDWREFFRNYYSPVETDDTKVNIEKTQLVKPYSLELKSAEGEPLSLRELYEKCSGSIVAISGYQKGQAGYNWGTGVIISSDGLILTNTHVIDQCDRATVTLADDQEYEAKLVGADSISDVALLKIEAKGLPVAEFGDSSTLQVGDPVAAIGNPLGESFRSTLTDGIISAIERDVSYKGRTMTLLQTNTALNEGNSGGALFNMYGQVIGVTNMKMMSSYSSIEGIGFAIPSTVVKEMIDSIVVNGEVRGRTSIGITVGAIPEEAMSQYELPSGLYITDVVPQSDAAAKGVQAGDILTQVNHQPVTTTAEIAAIKENMKVGDTMLFTIWRNGETFEVEVALMDTLDIYG